MKKLGKIVNLAFWALFSIAWLLSAFTFIFTALFNVEALMLPGKVFVLTSTFVLCSVIFDYLGDKLIKGIIKYKE